jgi:hypothetical protein
VRGAEAIVIVIVNITPILLAKWREEDWIENGGNSVSTLLH